MTRKPRTLSVEDARAVDLLLDHGAVGRSGFARVSAGVPQGRIAAVARLLATLDAMTPVEPTADLVARTLARVGSRSVVAPAAISDASHLSH